MERYKGRGNRIAIAILVILGLLSVVGFLTQVNMYLAVVGALGAGYVSHMLIKRIPKDVQD